MAKNLILKVGIKGAKKTTGALKSVGSAVTSIGIKAGIATAGFGAFSIIDEDVIIERGEGNIINLTFKSKTDGSA